MVVADISILALHVISCFKGLWYNFSDYFASYGTSADSKNTNWSIMINIQHHRKKFID